MLQSDVEGSDSQLPATTVTDVHNTCVNIHAGALRVNCYVRVTADHTEKSEIFTSRKLGAGIAQWLEHRTRD